MTPEFIEWWNNYVNGIEAAVAECQDAADEADAASHEAQAAAIRANIAARRCP